MPETAVEDVLWNLEDLVDGGGAEACDRLLDEADGARARVRRSATPGTSPSSTAPASPRRWTSSATISDLVGRAGNYAHLRFAADTDDQANGALVARVNERATAIETQLLFFDLEWAALDDARADELLAADGLDHVRHHLRTMRRYRPHLLSEPEEKLLAEKSVTGRDAWSRLFSELTSALRVELPGEDEPRAARRSR